MKSNKRTAGLSGKALTLVISMAVIAVITVGGTLAWLAAGTDSITNNFAPSEVTVDIEETFANNTKKDVKIKNTGEIDAYIRASYVVTWKNAGGNVIAKPDAASVTVTMGDPKWVQGSDGYWYYTEKVAPQGLTLNFINKATATFPVGSGYKMELTVLAQGIQALPEDAVESAWPIVTVNTNGSLTVS